MNERLPAGGDRQHAGASRPDTTQRAEGGRAARAGTPRSSHAQWERPPGTDAVAIVLAQESGRLPELLPIRHERMLASPLAFFRGAAAVMAADLADTPTSGLRVQACGDAHLSNFGVFAAPDRRLVFDINDFDETLAAPWEWDVKRLVASLVIAGRERGADAATRRTSAAESVASYRRTMTELAGKRDIEVWYARQEIDPSLRELGGQLSDEAATRARRRLKGARSKNSLRALERLTVATGDGGAPQIRSDPPLIVPISELASGRDAQTIETELGVLLDDYRSSLRPDLRRLMRGYHAVDLARKVVGVGSVGLRAWVILLIGRDEHDPLFLQAKEAGASVLETFAGRGPYAHQGRRVVEGQRLMQAAGDILLGWVRVTGPDDVQRDFYVRQLWDAKMSVDLESMEPATLDLYGRLCGATLARAHARSGDRIAIAAYLGKSSTFDDAVARFAEAHADQNERDFADMARALANDTVPADASG